MFNRIAKGWTMTLPSSDKPLCNENFEESRFNPHGFINLWPDGRIVHFDVTGPFNVEFTASVATLVDKLYAEVADGGPFAEIVFFRNSMLMPLEALPPLGDTFRIWKARGCAPVATAWVIEAKVEGSFVMLPQFEKIFAEAGQTFKCFDCMDEAEVWLKERLAEPSPRPLRAHA